MMLRLVAARSALSALGVLCVLCVLGALSSDAHAQPVARDLSVARQEFEAGIASARDGDWARARDHFARSHAINPRASALFNLAGAEARVGELVEAREHYRAYLALGAEDTANRAEAERAVPDLTDRIGTVRLVITGLSDADELALDATPLPRPMLESAIPLNPGAHQLVVHRAGDVVLDESIDVAERARREMTFHIENGSVDSEPTATVDVSPSRIAASETTRSDSSASHDLAVPIDGESDDDGAGLLGEWWFWTIVGVVLVGATVGFVVATNQHNGIPDSDGFQLLTPVRVP